jgi:hypothetical protein
MGVMYCDGSFLAGEGPEVGRIVSGLEYHTGTVTVPTGFEQVYERDGDPVFGKEPDAGPIHL